LKDQFAQITMHLPQKRNMNVVYCLSSLLQVYLHLAVPYHFFQHDIFTLLGFFFKYKQLYFQ